MFGTIFPSLEAFLCSGPPNGALCVLISYLSEMPGSEAEYGTVWYHPVDSEGVDGITGKYVLESKGSELIVTVSPKNEDQLENRPEKILFPWSRVVRIDTHERRAVNSRDSADSVETDV